jgi:hypothetical protein
MIEYYPGILFLTTNRIRTMDQAFQSRIHIAIEYEDLNRDARRLIWKNRIKGLPESMSSGLESSLEDLAAWKLNGRQIRNVFQVSQSVALKENMPLGYEHLVKVIRKTLEFQHFFKGAHEAVRSNLGTNWRNPNDYNQSEVFRDLKHTADARRRDFATRDRARLQQSPRENDSEENSDYERDWDRRRTGRSRW